MQRHRDLAAAIVVDAVLQSITKSGRVGPTFSAILNGGALTTWQHPGRFQLGPDFGAVFLTQLDRSFG